MSHTYVQCRVNVGRAYRTSEATAIASALPEGCDSFVIDGPTPGTRGMDALHVAQTPPPPPPSREPVHTLTVCAPVGAMSRPRAGLTAGAPPGSIRYWIKNAAQVCGTGVERVPRARLGAGSGLRVDRGNIRASVSGPWRARSRQIDPINIVEFEYSREREDAARQVCASTRSEACAHETGASLAYAPTTAWTP